MDGWHGIRSAKQQLDRVKLTHHNLCNEWSAPTILIEKRTRRGSILWLCVSERAASLRKTFSQHLIEIRFNLIWQNNNNNNRSSLFETNFFYPVRILTNAMMMTTKTTCTTTTTIIIIITIFAGVHALFFRRIDSVCSFVLRSTAHTAHSSPDIITNYTI